ncbi:BTB/POZ domain-containing protein At3g22104-like [Tasmannia lanceolata]|uniref:BTB/POZ domain-containing protein At3g22104-like n=1 Tax=Tasmannia lanceolata TaxID=3420 RepID=UPI00406445A3
MDVACDLEVDVNGEELFLVDKRILSSFSGKFSKLFNKPTAGSKLKVIFHDLPGGPEAFELMVRFCYNNGRAEITPSNISLLHCIAHFMEMTENISHSHNLIEQTEKSLQLITYWTWSEILVALKQCQDLFFPADPSGIFEKYLDSLLVRISSGSEASPSTSSPNSSSFRFSCDTGTTESTKKSYGRAWWFEHIAVLNFDIIDKIIKTMIARKFDHVLISRFLFYYLKSRVSTGMSNEKRKIVETVVNLLSLLDRSSVSCKGLFGILRVASSLNISKCCKNRLEGMIGSQLDQATLDNLLVPSPLRMNFLYDVNLVLRFLKSFLRSGFWASLTRLKRVGALMDLYISEVAPDICLKPLKFVELAMALPDSARDSYDGIYRATDMYLEVHTGLSEEEKMKICCVLNYEKLSSEACKHLARNSKFPSRTVIQALISQQTNLESLLHDTNHLKPFSYLPFNHSDESTEGKKGNRGDQIILYGKKLDLSMEDENLKAHLQGMQCRVMKLEKVCSKMQTQMAKVMKSRLSSSSNARLPKLCP